MPVDAAIISGVLTTLTPLVRDEFSLFWNFKKEVQKLSNTLSSLHAALKDAERKNLCEKDDQTEDWLQKLKDVAYEVRDIMDECTFEDLRLQVKRQNASSSTWIQVTNCFARPFSSTSMRLKIGHKIKDVLEKLSQISAERIQFQLPETTHDLKLETLTVGGRETMSLLSVNVYGREEDRKTIVDILVNSSNIDKRLSVLPIIGIGGLGKTTLAQMVFNDKNVDKYFDRKFWVCISEEFNLNQVMKDIIGDKSEASLEELQKKVRTQLNGKRYLIVLDDVWNEDENKWDTLRSILDCGLDGTFVLATTRKKKVVEIMKTNQHFELSPLSEDACWLLFKERAFRHETSKTTNLIDIGLEIAKKCKGVPLIAKTLGAQLGFKRDVNEWCRIRDSEMWKISQNEECDILCILRLSYNDLSYPLRRCFAFCAVFPKDAEIEKERLIQMWMAHDLIPRNENQEVEDAGNQIWDELCWRSFFQDEKNDISMREKYIQTCKMHDFMHDLAKSIMKDECYTMDSKSSSEDFRREIHHVTIMDNPNISIGVFKKAGGLQSIIGHLDYDNVFSKEILTVWKELSYLRVLEVSSCTQSEDLCYVGCLRHLRYLNLSSCEVKELPNSICDLLNLQTLNLNGCEFLKSLPRNTKNLINLRHLHLEGCDRLEYMPKGMGRLRHLKTLSMFVIGKESDGQLEELKELDIGGYMEIKNLESVCDASVVARGGISMPQKSSINQLVLSWNDSKRFHDDNESKSRDEKVCVALEVPATRLRSLGMAGYKGVNIPKWVGESSASLMCLTLYELENVEHIFNINNMSTRDMNGTVITLFPFLQELSIWSMKNLRELVSPLIPITTTIGAFPNLCKIEIYRCPMLGALPPHLKSLKTLKVDGECTDELIDSISDFSGLTSLFFTNIVIGRSVLFPAAAISNINDMNRTLFPLLEELRIWNIKNLRELVSPSIPITTYGAFPNLRKINIHKCPKLGALPPHLTSLKDVTVWNECSDELLYSISNLTALTHLSLEYIDERSVLFGGGGNYYKEDNEAEGGPHASSTFQSLQSLYIDDCPKLSRLLDEKLARGRGANCLTNNLNSLHISFCPELMISLEQWRNIGIHSLQSLHILCCPKLVPSSKVEEEEEAYDEVMALLHSLRERLDIDNFMVDILC